jgi:hypothetical protein
MTSIQLYKSTIEDRIRTMVRDYKNDTHETFLRFIYYLITGNNPKDLEPEEIIDKNGDYQIDSFHIEVSNEEQAIVTIIQVTYSDSLSTTKLISLGTGLDYIIRQPMDVYSRLSNEKLVDKIQEFRETRAEVLPSNVKIQCYYACLSDASKISGEFQEQTLKILSDNNSIGGDFSFEILGVNEIFELLNNRETKSVKVDERMRIIYDQNKANLIEHSTENVFGVICSVDASEIARIVKKHSSVFEENLRRFLGFSGSVNKAIKESCISKELAPLFWFLNNGITIVCDDFDVNKDFDNPFVDMKSLRIVNGCQTASALAKTFEDPKFPLQASAQVVVRILKTNSQGLSDRLVITTNTQNKITSRDMHAQDEIQNHLQVEFERRFAIKYERTTNEFGRLRDCEIISNEKIGQASLAVVKKHLSDANRRQYKLWGEYYNQVFSPNIFPETYLLSYRIVEFCQQYKRDLLFRQNISSVTKTIIKNGTYHIARIISFLWRNGDDWNDLEKTRNELERIMLDPNILSIYYENALKMLTEIIDSNDKFKEDLSVTLKSNHLEEAIEKRIYSFSV